MRREEKGIEEGKEEEEEGEGEEEEEEEGGRGEGGGGGRGGGGGGERRRREVTAMAKKRRTIAKADDGVRCRREGAVWYSVRVRGHNWPPTGDDDDAPPGIAKTRNYSLINCQRSQCDHMHLIFIGSPSGGRRKSGDPSSLSSPSPTNIITTTTSTPRIVGNENHKIEKKGRVSTNEKALGIHPSLINSNEQNINFLRRVEQQATLTSTSTSTATVTAPALAPVSAPAPAPTRWRLVRWRDEGRTELRKEMEREKKKRIGASSRRSIEYGQQVLYLSRRMEGRRRIG
ncbi:hypothetical protein HZH68_006880 [Vespula germanica]|uniref:Uncharacterized protein n=1 Tax=Vespula germanica TaxID=30212 RepID=A0A834N9S4_VESGE|nr:hypothetical protein HZH68_006880 [Vespula germanica]